MSTATFLSRMELYDRIATSGKFSAGTLAVAWVLLFKFYNSTTARCDPGQTAIGKAAAVSPRHVKRATDELAAAGWFIIKGGAGAMTKFGPTTAYMPQFGRVTDLSGGVEPVSPDETVTTDETRKDGVTNLSGKQGKDKQSNIMALLPDPVAEQFEKFWQTFPKRAGFPNPKKPAKQLFDRSIKAGIQPTEILTAAQAYREQVRTAGTPPQYVAQAVTWLRQERWRDIPEQADEPGLRAGMC